MWSIDLVDATVFPQDVVEGYMKTMKNEPNLVRTGTLLDKSPTYPNERGRLREILRARGAIVV